MPDWQWQRVVRELQKALPADFRYANQVFWDACCPLNALPPEPQCRNRVLGELVHCAWNIGFAISVIRPSLMWLAVTVNGWWVAWRISRQGAKAGSKERRQ